MKRVLLNGILPTIAIVTGSLGCFYIGRSYEASTHTENEHYRIHAAQLTANDIPIWFEDEIPGMGGTKEKPVLCGAYYDSTKQSVILFTVKNK